MNVQQNLTVYTDQESVIYIPDITQGVKKVFDDTPGLAQMQWNYVDKTAKFVMNDVFNRGPKEQAFVLPPAAFYLISQALKKLPLMSVIDQVFFDRLVSHIVQRSIQIRKDRIQRERAKAEEEAKKKEGENVK